MKRTNCILFAAAALALISCGISAQENLLKGGSFETPADIKCWNPGHWVHIDARDGNYLELLKQTAPFCSRKLSPGGKNGKMALNIATRKEFQSIKNNKGGLLTVSNYLLQTVNAAPGQYELTFFAKGKNEAVPGYNALRCFITFSDSAKKGTGTTFDRQLALNPDWKAEKLIFDVPAKAAAFTLRFSLYGAGEVMLDDLSVKKLK